MRGLAAFIMRGRLNALGVMIAAAFLPPLFYWVSGAVLALVTLRRGLREGALLLGGALLVQALLVALLTGQVGIPLWHLLTLWLPVMVLALWLRHSISFSGTMRLAGGIAAVAILGFHLLIPDPAAFWQQWLSRFDELVATVGPENRQAWQEMRDQLAPVMAGISVFVHTVLVIAALLLARWWQSLLYNPGGFRAEFHGLDLGKTYGYGGLLLFVAAIWQGPGLFNDLVLVLSVVFVLQALSLAHAGVALKNWSGVLLVILYLLLPMMFSLMAMVGIVGAAFGWRRRLQERAGPDGGPA